MSFINFDSLFTLHGLISLFILSLLELILGIDNIIFISLIITKIPEEKRLNTKVTALSLAFVMRIVMLFFIVWLSRITTTLFTVSNFDVSLKDILFFIGGAYLTFNTIKEIAAHISAKQSPGIKLNTSSKSYKSIILQIVVVDMLFSFDSVFTAIGLIPNFIIMALAVGVGMVFMIYLSGKTSVFIEKHPAIKTLALCFIILVGLLLMSKAFHLEIPTGYFYSALAFALAVEVLNMKMRNKKNIHS
jgi:predicted tellurium resistance membrane protein TerC